MPREGKPEIKKKYNIIERTTVFVLSTGKRLYSRIGDVRQGHVCHCIGRGVVHTQHSH